MSAAGMTARVRLKRWVTLTAILLFGGWFGHFVYLRLTLHPTPRPEYWTAKIAAIDPPGPNAVPAAAGSQAIRNLRYSVYGAAASQVSGDLSRILLGQWNANRADIQAANAIFQGASFENGRAELDAVLQPGWVEPEFGKSNWTSLIQYSEISKTIIYHSRWIRETRGDMQAATADWLTAVRLVRQARRPHIMLGEMLANSINAMVAREIMLVAREPHAAIDAAALAREMFELQPTSIDPATWFAGERLRMQSALEYMFVRDGGDWLDVSETAQLRAGGSTPRLWNLASPLFHDISTARRRVDREFDFVAQCTNLSICERLLHPRAPVDPETILSDLDGTPFEGLRMYLLRIQLAFVARTELDAALTMLVLSEHHRQLGRYPESLQQLVPDWLTRLPIDCVDGKPLRYHRSGDSYVLYSINLDGVDNGGKGDGKATASFYPGTADVVFSDTRRIELRK